MQRNIKNKSSWKGPRLQSSSVRQWFCRFPSWIFLRAGVPMFKAWVNIWKPLGSGSGANLWTGRKNVVCFHQLPFSLSLLPSIPTQFCIKCIVWDGGHDVFKLLDSETLHQMDCLVFSWILKHLPNDHDFEQNAALRRIILSLRLLLHNNMFFS